MANRKSRTPKKDRIFLESLTVNGVVEWAANLAGYGTTSLYAWRKQDPEFAQAWDEAVATSTGRLENEIFNRAVFGDETYVTSQGKVVMVEVEVAERDPITGEIVNVLKKRPLVERKKSDTLAIFLMKGRKPEVYRERYDVSAGPRPVQSAQELSDADLEEIASMAFEELQRRRVEASGEKGQE